MSSDRSTVDNAGFVEAVSTTVRALDRLSEVFLAMNERHAYLPRADSQAMAELARDAEFGAHGWKEPVHEAHVMGGMLAFAGNDHLQAFAHLLSSPPVPVYAHLTVARSAIEAYAWSHWMLTPGIGADVRIKRSYLFQLDDGEQRKRLPIEESKQRGREIIGRVRAGAPPGWTVICNDKQIVIAGELLPKPKEVIAEVLPSQGEAVDRLGAALWSILSGVSHSRRYALVMSMEMVEDRPQTAPLVGALFTTSTTVHLIGLAIARACITACNSRFRLLGWTDDNDWAAAVAAAEEHIHLVLASTAPDPTV